jgi:hypothetical protein
MKCHSHKNGDSNIQQRQLFLRKNAELNSLKGTCYELYGIKYFVSVKHLPPSLNQLHLNTLR